MKWTESEASLLAEMKLGGSTWKEISEAIGRSQDACRYRWEKIMGGRPPERSGITAESSLKGNLADERRKVRHLEKLLEDMERRLTASRRDGVNFKLDRVAPAESSRQFNRLIVPDSHGCFIDRDAAAAMLADLEHLEISEVVLLGDHMDCGGFLSQHHTWGFVAEMDYSFEDDINATNVFLDELQARIPAADWYYIEGNHEHRIEKWCVTQSARCGIDAARLLRQNDAPHVLHLEDRGVKYIRQGEYYNGARVPGSIKLGECWFTHGTCTAKHAASGMLDEYGSNVVYGHTHRQDSYVKRTVRDAAIGAWNPGCLCRLQPLWMHTKATKWTHGYGVQSVCRDSGSFLHLNIPLVDGVSMLSPLVAHT